MSNPLELAKRHLNNIVKLADNGEITWQEQAAPRPDAMRAFSASTKDYQIMVCQANVQHGKEPAHVIHEGMAIAISGTGPLVIRMTPEIADKLYHMAAAQRN